MPYYAGLYISNLLELYELSGRFPLRGTLFDTYSGAGHETHLKQNI